MQPGTNNKQQATTSLAFEIPVFQKVKESLAQPHQVVEASACLLNISLTY
jgi:hypothetical protein